MHGVQEYRVTVLPSQTLWCDVIVSPPTSTALQQSVMKKANLACFPQNPHYSLSSTHVKTSSSEICQKNR